MGKITESETVYRFIKKHPPNRELEASDASVKELGQVRKGLEKTAVLKKKQLEELQ